MLLAVFHNPASDIGFIIENIPITLFNPAGKYSCKTVNPGASAAVFPAVELTNPSRTASSVFRLVIMDEVMLRKIEENCRRGF